MSIMSEWCSWPCKAYTCANRGTLCADCSPGDTNHYERVEEIDESPIKIEIVEAEGKK